MLNDPTPAQNLEGRISAQNKRVVDPKKKKKVAKKPKFARFEGYSGDFQRQIFAINCRYNFLWMGAKFWLKSAYTIFS
jgi:hypothetical protein